jgi:hypothetical protein
MSLNNYLSCCILLSLGMLYISFSTCKMIEILFSDSDFTVTQCVIKLYRLFSNSICIQLNRHLLYGVIYLLVAMNLYKYVSCIGELEYSHTTSSIYLFTRSPYGMGVHFTTVVSERSWSPFWRRAHMAGDIGSVLMMTCGLR